jgi:hypothetical protein
MKSTLLRGIIGNSIIPLIGNSLTKTHLMITMSNMNLNLSQGTLHLGELNIILHLNHVDKHPQEGNLHQIEEGRLSYESWKLKTERY